SSNNLIAASGPQPVVSPAPTPAAARAPAAAGGAAATRGAPTAISTNEAGAIPNNLMGHLSDLASQLATQQRLVTMMVVDLQGDRSTRLSYTADQHKTLVKRCFDGLTELAQRHEGMVDRSNPDVLMVAFGAATSRDDDGERAVRCALDMLEYIEAANKQLP